MQAPWQKILIKIAFWLIVEVILNLLGLDNLADYSEFVFEGKAMLIKNYICEIVLET